MCRNKECYNCAHVDKVLMGWDGVHCAHGHLEGKDAWLPAHNKACKYWEKYHGKLVHYGMD